MRKTNRSHQQTEDLVDRLAIKMFHNIIKHQTGSEMEMSVMDWSRTLDVLDIAIERERELCRLECAETSHVLENLHDIFLKVTTLYSECKELSKHAEVINRATKNGEKLSE